MDLLSNWLFWIIVISIIFILALIGFLTENSKKSKKKNGEKDNSVIPQFNESNSTPVIDSSNMESSASQNAALNLDNGTWNNIQSNNVDTVQAVTNDDWSVMPQVNVQKIVDPMVSSTPVQEVPAPAAEVAPVTPAAPVQEVPAPAAEVAPVTLAAPVQEVPAPAVEVAPVTPAAPVQEVPAPAVEVAPVTPAAPVQEVPINTDANIWK